MTIRGGPNVIGVTAAGRPIITSTGYCAHFERQMSALITIRECWYCMHADFRDNTALQKDYGVCRREGDKLSSKLTDDDLEAVVGGVIVESAQAVYKCQCGAVFCCPLAECPICYSTEIQKIK